MSEKLVQEVSPPPVAPPPPPVESYLPNGTWGSFGAPDYTVGYYEDAKLPGYQRWQTLAMTRTRWGARRKLRKFSDQAGVQIREGMIVGVDS